MNYITDEWLTYIQTQPANLTQPHYFILKPLASSSCHVTLIPSKRVTYFMYGSFRSSCKGLVVAWRLTIVQNSMGLSAECWLSEAYVTGDCAFMTFVVRTKTSCHRTVSVDMVSSYTRNNYLRLWVMPIIRFFGEWMNRFLVGVGDRSRAIIGSSVPRKRSTHPPRTCMEFTTRRLHKS